jgi:hypothetical protein
MRCQPSDCGQEKVSILSRYFFCVRSPENRLRTASEYRYFFRVRSKDRIITTAAVEIGSDTEIREYGRTAMRRRPDQQQLLEAGAPERVRPPPRPVSRSGSSIRYQPERREACRRAPAIDLGGRIDRCHLVGRCIQNQRCTANAPLGCTACTEAETIGDHPYLSAKPINDRCVHLAPCTGGAWDSRRAPCAAPWSRVSEIGSSIAAPGFEPASGHRISGKRPSTIVAHARSIVGRSFRDRIAVRARLPAATRPSHRSRSETLGTFSQLWSHARRSRAAFLRIQSADFSICIVGAA